MSNISELKNVPDVVFTDTDGLQETRDRIMADYSAAYQAETGVTPRLNPGNAERIMLNSFAALFYQLKQYIERSGKMGLLKFSEGAFLDNLAALRGLTRQGATPAGCTIKFTLSDARASATGIPGGTRLSADGCYFATDEYFEIPAGELTGTVHATAVEPGNGSNGIVAGELDTLVDPLPYVSSAVNTTTTNGGTEVESDDSLTRRIYTASAGFSVAGPAEAYVQFTKAAVPSAGHIVAYSPSACEVRVVFVQEDGSLPTEDQINIATKVLQNDAVRPLTDHVVVSAPDEVGYSINVTYYIATDDSATAAAIQTAVDAAVEEYKLWQRKVGRDVTPSKLIQLMMQAGAKRVKVTAPNNTVVDPYKVARCNSTNVVYGGLEDD